MHTGFRNTSFDSLIGSAHISGNSTGSYVQNNIGYSYYGNSLYVNGSAGNAGFESAFVSGAGNWFSGINGGQYMFAGQATNWASKTESNNARLIGSFQNVAGQLDGSGIIMQQIDMTNAIGIRVSHAYALNGASTKPTLTISISGINIFEVSSGSIESLNTFYHLGNGSNLIGSQNLKFMLRGPNITTENSGEWNIDEVKIVRWGSGNSIPDTLSSSGLTAESGKNFRTGFFYMNGSFISGNSGSFFLSANGGTNWEAVGNGSGIKFANVGTNLKARMDMYSSGTYPCQIFNYGITAIQS